VSTLVEQAIAAAGLEDVLLERRAGDLRTIDANRLAASDLLVLGALADRVRAEEVGSVVRVLTSPPLGGAGVVTFPAAEEKVPCLDLLRAVAMARLTGPRSVTVRVDFGQSGLEIAQIALNFGANELMGPIVSKSGAAFAAGALAGVGKKSRLELASALKRREIEGFIHLAGRVPVFVDAEPRAPTEGRPTAQDGRP
jgi:hypothetical protein